MCSVRDFAVENVDVNDELVAGHGSRIIAIPGIHNLRDLGGLPAGGRRSALGHLYRSENPRNVRLMADALGLATVVDLRRAEELIQPVDWGSIDVDYLHTPLVSSHGNSWTAGYTQYLESSPKAIVAAIRKLTRPENHPALFHCAAGKDRTGIIAALLLDLLEVSRDAIVADFALTGDSIEAIIEQLAKADPYRNMLAGMTPEQHLPHEDKLWEMFSVLDKRWGSSEEWLVGNGMPEEEIAAYRAIMLADDSDVKSLE